MTARTYCAQWQADAWHPEGLGTGEPLQSKQLLQEHPRTSLDILASKEQVFHLVSASRVVRYCPGVRSGFSHLEDLRRCIDHVGMGQNHVALVNIKIAGKWMFIPLKMVLIGIDPYPCFLTTWVTCDCWESRGTFQLLSPVAQAPLRLSTLQPASLPQCIVRILPQGVLAVSPHHPDVELSSFMHYGHAVPFFLMASWLNNVE